MFANYSLTKGSRDYLDENLRASALSELQVGAILDSHARSPGALVSHPMTKKSAGASRSNIPLRATSKSAVDSCLLQCTDAAVSHRPPRATRTTATRALVVLQAFSTSALTPAPKAASSAVRTGALKDSATLLRGTSTIVYSSRAAGKHLYCAVIAGKSQSARPSCTQMIDAPVLRK